MKKIKVLLVEDAAYVEVALQSRLADMNFEVQGIVSKPDQVIPFLEKNSVDVILMDMFSDEAYSGLDAAKKIDEKFAIPVIFTCGEDRIEFSDLKDIPAYALLFKPMKDAEIAFNITAALAAKHSVAETKVEFSERSKSYIFVRADYRLNKIRVNDIYYLEAKKDYVTIHTTDNVYTVHATMKDMEKLLPDDLFIRTHRSYIVNVDKIFSIKYPDILIEHKMKTIQIGGLYRKDLFNKINVI